MNGVVWTLIGGAKAALPSLCALPIQVPGAGWPVRGEVLGEKGHQGGVHRAGALFGGVVAGALDLDMVDVLGNVGQAVGYAVAHGEFSAEGEDGQGEGGLCPVLDGLRVGVCRAVVAEAGGQACGVPVGGQVGVFGIAGQAGGSGAVAQEGAVVGVLAAGDQGLAQARGPVEGSVPLGRVGR